MLISPAFAQQAAAGGGSLFSTFVPLLLIFAVFYFLLIRPQMRRQKEHRARLAALRRGDKVLTAGGVFGVITKIGDNGEAQVEIAEGVKVRVATHTITDVISKPQPAANDAKGSDGNGDADGKGGGLLGRLFGGGQKK